MAYSNDADLLKLIPDILDLGIESFVLEHPKAQADIQRELRIKWWPRKNISGEMDNTKLTATQFTTVSAYLVLWRYALPQLTNWTEGDRFGNMIEFYKARYGEELRAIKRGHRQLNSGPHNVHCRGEHGTTRVRYPASG